MLISILATWIWDCVSVISSFLCWNSYFTRRGNHLVGGRNEVPDFSLFITPQSTAFSTTLHLLWPCCISDRFRFYSIACERVCMFMFIVLYVDNLCLAIFIYTILLAIYVFEHNFIVSQKSTCYDTIDLIIIEITFSFVYHAPRNTVWW